MTSKIKSKRKFNVLGICDGCGMPTQSQKLRPDDQGGLSIFCRDCIQEGKAIASMTPEERDACGIEC